MQRQLWGGYAQGAQEKYKKMARVMGLEAQGER